MGSMSYQECLLLCIMQTASGIHAGHCAARGPAKLCCISGLIAFHPYIHHNLVCCWFVATWTFVTCIMESTVDLPSLQLASHAHCAAVVHTGLWHVIHVPCSILYICYDARVHLKRQLHKVDP